MKSSTEVLRRLLDERGVEWGNIRSDGSESDYLTEWQFEDNQSKAIAVEWAVGSGLSVEIHRYHLTPEQAIAATLGREPWVNPTWERWHKSLRHDEIKSIGDAVEQLMYEAIEFGGDMGPNGNTYNGIDEGDVLTAGFINEWVARFEATLGSGTCHDLAETPSYRDKTEFKCSECGYEYSAVGGFGCDSGDEPDFNFCPNCGRRVEVDE